MEDKYTLQRYSRGVFIYLGNNRVYIESFYTSTSTFIRSGKLIMSVYKIKMYKIRGLTDIKYRKDTFIEYDKQKKNISSWGDCDVKSDTDDSVKINKFTEKLYQLFKKDRDCWSQDDTFLLQAISDFMRLSIEQLIKESKELKVTRDLHYILVVPSEWEEDIREDVIQPIFIQANLISKNDHKDRILFCSDLESFYYYTSTFFHKPAKDTVLCRLTPIKKNRVLIKLDLVSSINSLFDFSDSLLFPKVVNSNSLDLSISHIKDSIRALLKNTLFLSIREENLERIIEAIFSSISYTKDKNEDDEMFLMVPLITNTREWDLNTCQETSIKTIRPYDICAELSKYVPNNVKDLISNNLLKDYPIITTIDKYSTEIELDQNLVDWSKSMLEYNRINSGRRTSNKFRNFNRDFLQIGAIAYVYEAIQSSNMYSKPIILPTDELASYSSIFVKSKPDAIMNIEISLESTLLSFSLLDDNGLIKDIWDHNYFIKDACLHSLGSFFKISDIPILNVKYRFIAFTKKYFIDDSDILSNDKDVTLNMDTMAEIEEILNFESPKNDLLVSIQQQVFIKAFIMIYMIYIKNIISNKLKTIASLNFDIKIGYAISIENMVLNYLFGSKEELQDIIYTSGLLQKDDKSSKLRIMTQEEALLPIIQQSLKLPLTLRYFFVLAQLHKDYVQLTLNQIVVESSPQEDQESIIIRNEIIHIPNIYDSLSLSMWNKVVGGSSLIQLCDTHTNPRDKEFLDLFTIQNRKYFRANFKRYISKNILNKNYILKDNDKININISNSCSCVACLTVNDIIYISFRPVLQDIISLVSTSLINNQFFGKYINIQYILYLILFNHNSHLQPILIKILNDETNYFIYEHEIDIHHYVIPQLSRQLLQPVHQQRPFSYKGFQMGTLHHVHCGNFGFNFITVPKDANASYKNRRSDTKAILIEGETSLPAFLKGHKVRNYQINRVLCLKQQKSIIDISIGIEYFKFNDMRSLGFGETVPPKNMSEPIIGPFLSSKEFKQDQDLAVAISVIYNGYSSSFSFMPRRAGEAIKEPLLVTITDPMNLARF
ncbi:hypothetical protein BDF21DRAFT_494319 [Thamnidium elegans]|nr:hypothetical protein BDF21DRAFT_494319 [Thamnidium elegans]